MFRSWIPISGLVVAAQDSMFSCTLPFLSGVQLFSCLDERQLNMHTSRKFTQEQYPRTFSIITRANYLINIHFSTLAFAGIFLRGARRGAALPVSGSCLQLRPHGPEQSRHIGLTNHKLVCWACNQPYSFKYLRQVLLHVQYPLRVCFEFPVPPNPFSILISTNGNKTATHLSYISTRLSLCSLKLLTFAVVAERSFNLHTQTN